PGAFTKVPVVIGGYDGLDGIADLALRIEQIPQTNSKVELHHSNSVLVRDAVLSVNLKTEDFTRGALGKASFTLENTSDVEAEIVMAESGGGSASSEVRLIMEDLDGNVLATQPVKQVSGDVI